LSPAASDDIQREDVVVLEALVLRLREVIESAEHNREHWRQQPEEDEEAVDFEYKREGDLDESTMRVIEMH
jgi:hypothetical protein